MIHISIGFTKLLVGVGAGDPGALNSIEIFDLGSPTNVCEDLNIFPRRFDAAIGGLISNRNPLICGGCGWHGTTSISDCSLYEDGVWNSFQSMTTARCNAASSPSPYPNGAHSLFVTGGYNLSTAEFLTERGWQKLSTYLPVTIALHCMVLLNSTTVLIIGGYQNGAGYSPNTLYFNAENEEWVQGPQLLKGRNVPSCGKLKKDSQSSEKSIIVVGGNDKGFISSVEILDVGASEWKSGPSLQYGILGASMVEDSFGGVILIGGDNGTTFLDSLYQLSHANSEWLLMPQKLKVGRRYATSFLVPDEITLCK